MVAKYPAGELWGCPMYLNQMQRAGIRLGPGPSKIYRSAFFPGRCGSYHISTITEASSAIPAFSCMQSIASSHIVPVGAHTSSPGFSA